MLILKRNLAILPAAQVHPDSYFALDHVQVDIEAGVMRAANGHSLYETELNDCSDDEYPEVAPKDTVASKECMLIPANALIKAEKNIPKKTGGVRLPIWAENIQVRIDEEYKYLATTSLDITDLVKVRHPENNEWPDVRRIKSSVEEAKKSLIGGEGTSIVLGVSELETLIKVLKKNSAEKYVTLTVYDEKTPIEVEAKKLKSWIMPWVLPKK